MKSLKIFINSINYGINLRMKINNVRVTNNPISKFENLFINKITKKDLLNLMRFTSYKKSDIDKYLRSENYKNLVTLQKHIYLHPAIYSILGTEGYYTIIRMSLLSTVTGIKVPYIKVPNSIQFICGSIIYFKVKNANLDIVLKYLNDNPNVLRGGLESVDIIKDIYIKDEMKIYMSHEI